MAKELPYYKFEPGEWLSGDIQFCSYAAKGLFQDVCAIYWQRNLNLNLAQLKRRFSDDEATLNVLINEGIISIVGEDNSVSIRFLDEQYSDILESKKRLSEAGKKGAELKKNKSKIKGGLSQASTTLKQPDKIREDKIREDKEYIDREIKFLDLFNKIKSEVRGKKSYHSVLSKMDKSNLNKALKHNLKQDDWIRGIKNMLNDKWPKENKQDNPSHFLRENNFIKYIEREDSVKAYAVTGMAKGYEEILKSQND